MCLGVLSDTFLGLSFLVGTPLSNLRLGWTSPLDDEVRESVHLRQHRGAPRHR